MFITATVDVQYTEAANDIITLVTLLKKHQEVLSPEESEIINGILGRVSCGLKITRDRIQSLGTRTCE